MIEEPCWLVSCWLVLLAVALLVVVTHVSAQTVQTAAIAIAHVTVIDGTDHPPKPNTTVLIRDGRFARSKTPRRICRPVQLQSTGPVNF